MGKKLKKGKQQRKPSHRQAASSLRAADFQKPLDSLPEHVGAEGLVDGDPCEHYEKNSAAFQQIISKIRSSDRDAACEDCRDDLSGQRGGKGKNKATRKKGGATPAEDMIWVCLSCIHFGCGGGLKDLMPYGHARRHFKQENHLLAVRLDSVLTCFCFSCNSLIRIQMPDGVNAGLPSARSNEAVSIADSDDGPRPSSANSENVSKGYAVRGLINLGNTCFFNSIMQNLLSMGVLREYFSNLTETLGPVTMSLKKLFAETSINAEASRSTINPKSLFGCICSKAPQFKGYQQQDSHELLRYLLDALCTEEQNAKKHSRSFGDHKSARRGSTTFVDVIFGGQLSSTVCCAECGHTSIVYEPFLDLSLPVPSKGALQKKPSSAKRSKFSTRQEVRVRKARERVNTRSTTSRTERASIADNAQSNSEPANVLPESSATSSYCTPHDKNQTSVSAPGDDSWWLDFVEPVADGSQNLMETAGVMQEASESYSATAQDQDETSILTAADDDSLSDVVGLPFQSSEDICQKKSKYQETCCGSDLKSSPDLLEEKCPPQSAVEISDNKPVMVLAYNENKYAHSQGQDLLKMNSAPVVGDKLAEDEVSLLGDLFAEPEIDSSTVVPKSIGENSNTSSLEGTGSESNQEEVDNTDAPVSVARCLAYFTKPELLSDEHAWHCENCSKILQQQMLEKSRGKQPVDKDDASEAIDSTFSFERSLSANEKPSLLAHEQHIMVSDGELNCQANGFTDINSSLPDHNSDNCSGNSGKDEDITVSSDSNYLSCNSTSTSASEYSQSSTGPTVNAQGALIRNRELEDGAPVNDGRMGVPQRKKTAKVACRMKNSKENENSSEDVKVLRDATKRILINKVPPILTIHLKRFNQDARGRLNKLKGHVSFTDLVDLGSYLDPRCQTGENCYYHLVGVVEHSGGMGGGHYVAYVKGERATGKSADGSRWFYASDAHVREASLSEVLQSEAYILFYEQIHQ